MLMLCKKVPEKPGEYGVILTSQHVSSSLKVRFGFNFEQGEQTAK